MSIKTNLSLVLVALLMSANAFAVRVTNPRLISELNKFYAHMESEGRLGELSKEAKKVCSCIKKGLPAGASAQEGAEYNQDDLIKAIREAQSHGFMVRAYAPESCVPLKKLAPRMQQQVRS